MYISARAMSFAMIGIASLTAVACKGEPPVVMDAAAPVVVVDAAPRRPPDPVGDSLAFLAKLEKLMDGYVPSLPPSETDANLLRCVTSRALTSDPALKSAGDKLITKRDKARKERDKALAELYALSFRIDHDWRTKKRDIPAVYGCCDTDDGKKNLGNCETSYSAAGCNSVGGLWAVVVPADTGKYVYTRTTQAPTSPPEVMTSIQDAKLEIPARFACKVDDVGSEKMLTLAPTDDPNTFTEKTSQFWIVSCAAPSALEVVLRISGDLATINAGDVVSVPFAAAHRPEGVLLKTAGERTLRWTVDADATALTVDVAATCPSVSEIVAAAKK